MNELSYQDPDAQLRAFIPRASAALSAPWTKTSLLNLVDEVGPHMGLNTTDLAVLRRIAKKTPAASYGSPTESPICYERQIDMAASLGLSAVQFRRIEAKLHRLGFLRRDTAANGYRGGRSTSYGERSIAGLSFDPLIARLEELLQVKASVQRDQEVMAQYRLEIAIWRRRLALLYEQLEDNSFAETIELSRLTWRRPRAYQDAAALAEHYFELESLVSQAEAKLELHNEMIAAPIISDRRHIQNTTESRIESCSDTASASSQKRTACKQADTKILDDAPDGASCLEKKKEGRNQARSQKTPDESITLAADNQEFVDRLTFDQIHSLASDEMRLYIDHLRSGPPSLLDFEQAGIHRARDLGINPSAYEDAISAMGWKAALVSLIVIDRNQQHPKETFRIRSPGGAMRAFIRQHKRGTLNIQASIFGIWARHNEEPIT